MELTLKTTQKLEKQLNEVIEALRSTTILSATGFLRLEQGALSLRAHNRKAAGLKRYEHTPEAKARIAAARIASNREKEAS